MKHGTLKEVHLSHSQVSEFVQCPRKYHIHRRLGLAPEFMPSGLLFGSAIHEALALYHQQRLEGKSATEEQLYRAFIEDWDEEQLPVRYRPGESEGTTNHNGCLGRMRIKHDPSSRPSARCSLVRAWLWQLLAQ